MLRYLAGLAVMLCGVVSWGVGSYSSMRLALLVHCECLAPLSLLLESVQGGEDVVTL